MRARSAVFDLFGDHLLQRGGWAPVAAIVALNATCGVSAPTTRTALSRMVAQGWLERRSDGSGRRGYLATPVARERLTHARERVYASRPAPWDGRWHLVIVRAPESRRVRHRVQAAMSFLGYGRMARDTWVSPRPSEEVPGALGVLGVEYTTVLGSSPRDPADLAGSVWDLATVAKAYREFAASMPDPRVADGAEPATAYTVRTDLVHRWRTFLFVDPDLPAEALPSGWPGHAAREKFLACAAALTPASDTYVDAVLAGVGEAHHHVEQAEATS